MIYKASELHLFGLLNSEGHLRVLADKVCLTRMVWTLVLDLARNFVYCGQIELNRWWVQLSGVSVMADGVSKHDFCDT